MFINLNEEKQNLLEVKVVVGSDLVLNSYTFHIKDLGA